VAALRRLDAGEFVSPGHVGEHTQDEDGTQRLYVLLLAVLLVAFLLVCLLQQREGKRRAAQSTAARMDRAGGSSPLSAHSGPAAWGSSPSLLTSVSDIDPLLAVNQPGCWAPMETNSMLQGQPPMTQSMYGPQFATSPYVDGATPGYVDAGRLMSQMGSSPPPSQAGPAPGRLCSSSSSSSPAIADWEDDLLASSRGRRGGVPPRGPYDEDPLQGPAHAHHEIEAWWGHRRLGWSPHHGLEAPGQAVCSALQAYPREETASPTSRVSLSPSRLRAQDHIDLLTQRLNLAPVPGGGGGIAAAGGGLQV